MQLVENQAPTSRDYPKMIPHPLFPNDELKEVTARTEADHVRLNPKHHAQMLKEREARKMQPADVAQEAVLAERNRCAQLVLALIEDGELGYKVSQAILGEENLRPMAGLKLPEKTDSEKPATKATPKNKKADEVAA